MGREMSLPYTVETDGMESWPTAATSPYRAARAWVREHLPGESSRFTCRSVTSDRAGRVRVDVLINGSPIHALYIRRS